MYLCVCTCVYMCICVSVCVCVCVRVCVVMLTASCTCCVFVCAYEVREHVLVTACVCKSCVHASV